MKVVAETQVTRVEIDERISVRIGRLVDLAKAIRVTTPAERTSAVSLLTNFGSQRRETEKEMDTVLKPLRQRVEDARAPFKLAIDTLAQWESHVKKHLLTYDQEELRKARERQAKENAKTEQINEQAIKKADVAGVPPILKAPTIVALPPKTTKTEEGSATRMAVKTWRIEGIGPDEDLSKISASDPRLLNIDRSNLVLNISRINKLVKLGDQPQGVIVEETFEYRTRG